MQYIYWVIQEGSCKTCGKNLLKISTSTHGVCVLH